MANDWKEVSLGEIGRVVTGKTPKTKVIENFGHEIPFITPRDMDDQRIISETERYLSKVGSVSVKNSIIPANSISVSCIGSDMGKSAITKYLSVTNQQINSIVVSDEFYYKFVYYNLSSRKAEIRGLAGGSAQPILNKSDFSQIKMFVPPLSEQKAIAHILGSLDDKIELNRQMNETLEAMVQALFKSWFVDFDPVIDNALAAGNAIPDEFIERAEQRKAIEKKDNAEIQDLFPDEFEFTEEMGWVPKGWAIRNLSEMVSIIIDHRGKTPKKLGGDWAESGYPAISAKNIKGNKLVRPDTIRFVDKDIYDKWMKVPLEVGDVIMTSEAPLGELYYLNSKVDYLLSQRLYAIRADKINCTGSYLFYWFQTEFGSAEIQNRATGTTVFGIKQSELRKVLVLCPPSSVLESFDKYSHVLLEKMDANDLSITELAKLRDTLLPKLMSGELRIADAAALVDEAI